MGQERGRRPGMVDVARRAGVSHQTVSRVLNNPASVRPATRERVLAAIEELGYRRNMAARAMPVLGATAIRPSTPRLTRKPSASSISASSPT